MSKFFIIFTALALASCQMPLRSAQAEPYQQVIRDASGRAIGTAATDSQGTTTFRDAGGRTTGTASPSSNGTTTFRDSSGRTTGSTTAPRGGR
jgi:hypothetical protein